MQRVTKTFPGVNALDGVDFTLRCGEIHALMGENGAGKSTLIKVLTGVYRRDVGEIFLEGVTLDPHSPRAAQNAGISTVYQEVNLVPALSVAENIFLGRQPMCWGRIDWKTMNRRAAQTLRRLDLDIDVTHQLSSFSIAIQQMVAIARAVDVSAKLLILDEPTSSLDANEVRRLFEVMRKLKAEGLGIIFVTHFLEQVYQITDRITVLRNGKLVGEFETRSLPRVELIARMMGRNLAEVNALAEHHKTEREAARAPFLQVRGLGKHRCIQPFDLDVAPAEIVGLAGLLGSGRTEMARLLFGLETSDSGSIDLDGKPASLPTPRDSIAHGFGFCPEDRKTEGIVPDLSVRENILLVLQTQRGWWRRVPRVEQNHLAGQYIKSLNIATNDAEKPIKFLSGGNQQKAILARWLAVRPRFLMLDEPTRGIDVGAKFEIARLMNSLCREGMSLLFISSELEEVVRSSDRVVVLRDRQKVSELTGAQINEAAIMRTIAGSNPDSNHSP